MLAMALSVAGFPALLLLSGSGSHPTVGAVRCFSRSHLSQKAEPGGLQDPSGTVPLEPTDPASQAARLAQLRPIAWFHVPKTGNSFLNFLINLPGNCPGVPSDYADVHPGNKPHDFEDEYGMVGPNSSCPGTFDDQIKDGNVGPESYSHRGIDRLWHARKDHLVTMLRQPEQRLLSGYHYHQFMWWTSIDEKPPRNELQYAREMAGCAVKMLTKNKKVACVRGYWPKPTRRAVALAIKRLRTFPFVGLSDEWALSMCLGHRMFGGRCRHSDFMNNRLPPGGGGARLISIKHNTSVLKGWRDPYDGPLYEAAQDRFWRDCARYNVSAESCQPCFQEAGVELWKHVSGLWSE